MHKRTPHTEDDVKKGGQVTKPQMGKQSFLTISHPGREFSKSFFFSDVQICLHVNERPNHTEKKKSLFVNR